MKQRSAIAELPNFHDRSGTLGFMQVGDHIPFDVDNVRWVSGIASQASLGEHPAGSFEHVIVALAGSLEIQVIDEGDAHVFGLHHPHQRLHVPRSGAWALQSASPDAIVLVVASAPANAIDSALVTGSPTLGQATAATRSIVDDCAIVELPLHDVPSGSQTMLRSEPEFGRPIHRVYYLTDIPRGAARGGHAHRELHQFLVAAHGAFDVRIDDGVRQRTITLSRPDRALHLVPGIWRDLNDFTTGSICLVIASSRYDEQDYLRDYDEFRAFKGR